MTYTNLEWTEEDHGWAAETELGIKLTLRIEPEHMAVEGNASAWDDDEENTKYWQWIHDQLEAGNEWAWCCVMVEARVLGCAGSDSLGGCCYKSFEEFVVPDGYISQMVKQAIDNLMDELFLAVGAGEDARRWLMRDKARPTYKCTDCQKELGRVPPVAPNGDTVCVSCANKRSRESVAP